MRVKISKFAFFHDVLIRSCPSSLSQLMGNALSLGEGKGGTERRFPSVVFYSQQILHINIAYKKPITVILSWLDPGHAVV